MLGVIEKKKKEKRLDPLLSIAMMDLSEAPGLENTSGAPTRLTLCVYVCILVCMCVQYVCVCVCMCVCLCVCLYDFVSFPECTRQRL